MPVHSNLLSSCCHCHCCCWYCCCHCWLLLSHWSCLCHKVNSNECRRAATRDATVGGNKRRAARNQRPAMSVSLPPWRKTGSPTVPATTPAHSLHAVFQGWLPVSSRRCCHTAYRTLQIWKKQLRKSWTRLMRIIIRQPVSSFSRL